ncbi:Fic family protein [Pseudomonas viridiflava]|uniref:Fic family protein n=1 Tax=Pseudomonas viridiflava TaxID=33069 RepID=UPI001784A242|nr:Fic family protein [Pseudomonas viridiflava]
MIKLPPKHEMNPFTDMSKRFPDQVGLYLSLHNALDEKGRYLHFDKMRFRIPAELDSTVAWSVIKAARSRQLFEVLRLGEPETIGKMLFTPAIQMAMSESDRHTTSAALEWMSSKIGEQKHIAYLLNDLVEDEAISSSQLEGAATTTKAAKDLLKRQRGPRTADEKMIFGNYRMMQCAWEAREQPLSADLIAHFHLVGVEGIDDDHYYPGVFRAQKDPVVVEDGDGNIVHTPPSAIGLEKRLSALSDWANTNHSDVINKNYLHPLIKAIVLHFSIGYEHPFHDGNGRVARCLFYWYMFKHGFAAFRFIAISKLLKSAPVQYGKSYLYTETDEMDLTYFVDYQCRTIIRAISKFKEAYQDTVDSINRFNVFLYESGLFGKLNDKQKVVLQVAKTGAALNFTAVSVKENLDCSYNTASSVLNGLVDHGLFRKRKSGREWIFSMIPTTQIIKEWKS